MGRIAKALGTDDAAKGMYDLAAAIGAMWIHRLLMVPMPFAILYRDKTRVLR